MVPFLQFFIRGIRTILVVSEYGENLTKDNSFEWSTNVDTDDVEVGNVSTKSVILPLSSFPFSHMKEISHSEEVTQKVLRGEVQKTNW